MFLEIPIWRRRFAFEYFEYLSINCKTVEEIIIKDFAKQTDVAFIKKIETGRWKIVDNKMYFYDNDNQTPLLVFELKDINGIPTMVNAFEQIPL